MNRVFYMDEGGIYEDGSPEQIFEHPQREKTLRFVRRLKVLEMDSKSWDYDFPGMLSLIRNHCDRNQISPKLANRIGLVFEETMQLLVRRMEKPHIHAVLEYSPVTEEARWRIRYDGERYDITACDDLPSVLLKGLNDDIEYTWQSDARLPNFLRMLVKP